MKENEMRTIEVTEGTYRRIKDLNKTKFKDMTEPEMMKLALCFLEDYYNGKYIDLKVYKYMKKIK